MEWKSPETAPISGESFIAMVGHRHGNVIAAFYSKSLGTPAFYDFISDEVLPLRRMIGWIELPPGYHQDCPGG